MPDELRDELQVLRAMVLAAGTSLLESLGRVRTIEAKGATEFVTDVDRRIEEQLLAELADRFPDDAVEAEEAGVSAGESGRIWYLDPLDGTTNFAHGHPFFAVSLACVDAIGLRLGAVYAPYLDELYLAGRGGGAVLESPRNGSSRTLASRRETVLEQALLATGFPYVRDRAVDRTLAQIGAFLKAPCHGVRRAGSAAIDLAHVAAGKLDGYWELNLRPWDTAAGTLIAREAGAVVTDAAGVPTELPHASVLAAAPGLHVVMAGMLARTEENPT